MTIVAIHSASFCQGQDIAEAVAKKLGYARLEDEEIFAAASERSGVGAEKLAGAVHGRRGFLGTAQRHRGKHVAYVRLALARILERDGRVYHGLCGHLIPGSVSHVLKVCVAGRRAHRLEQAVRHGSTRKEAERRIERDDESHASWTRYLHDKDPWDKQLSDLFIPAQDTPVDAAVEMICENARNPTVATTPEALSALSDFQLSAEVHAVLAQRGHEVDVAAKGGVVEILIHKHSLLLKRLEKELEDLARGVTGVREVTARPGPRYQEPNIYVNIPADLPRKVLLVDDEKEFVHTLSERLQTRSIESTIAYDGEEALAKVRRDEPDVMVLDLKMPGIDGLEVLRRLKADHPDTEVIILTGHGSDAEETLASQLGAFAYLRKPVDINALTRTMQEAYRKVAESKTEKPPDST